MSEQKEVNFTEVNAITQTALAEVRAKNLGASVQTLLKRPLEGRDGLIGGYRDLGIIIAGLINVPQRGNRVDIVGNEVREMRRLQPGEEGSDIYAETQSGLWTALNPETLAIIQHPEDITAFGATPREEALTVMVEGYLKIAEAYNLSQEDLQREVEKIQELQRTNKTTDQ